MRRHHGLTLVEVLAATVLLAILAAACVLLLQRAMRALQPPDPGFEFLELAQLADLFIADPSTLGGEALPQEGEHQALWPEHPDRPLITVHRLTANDPEAEYAWLVVSSGQWAVHRWVPNDREEEELRP